MPKGIPNSAEMYGIYPRPWGFDVSIMRNGKKYRAGFGAASHGSAQLALAHARAWRDALVRSVPPVERRVRAQKLRPNNRTGVPGVFELRSANGKLHGWMARTCLAHDQMVCTRFSTTGFGSAARNLAIRARAQQLQRMPGLARVHPAEEAIRSAPPSYVPLPPKRSRAEIVRKNNSSGTPGVSFKLPRQGHPGYWLAITYTAGKGTVSKAFSVAEHGHEKAKELALAERRRQLEKKSREK